MKRFLAAVWCGGAAVWLTASVQAAPKIQFDKTIYDFGTTSLVQSVTGSFTVENPGDAELDLQKPSTTCGCTVAEVDPSKLKPGEKGLLRFTMNVSNVHGRAQKFINVPSNDPAQPSVRLTVQVDVKQLLEVTPQDVRLGMVPLGTTTNVTIQVKRTDGQKLNLTRVQTVQTNLTARLEPGDDPAGVTGKVVVELKSAGLPRRFADQIQVYMDSAAAPAFLVQVSGQIVGEVTVQPEKLVWGIGQAERMPVQQLEHALTRSLRIMSTGKDAHLELKNVATTLTGLNVEVRTLEQGRSYLVVAKFPAPPKSSETGTITVETNLASTPKLEVPVSVTVIQR